MNDRAPPLTVVPLAERVEAQRREDRSDIVTAAREALAKAERGELVGLVFAYQYADDSKKSGAVGCHWGIAPGANAATLIGELEVAKSHLWARYFASGESEDDDPDEPEPDSGPDVSG